MFSNISTTTSVVLYNITKLYLANWATHLEQQARGGRERGWGRERERTPFSCFSYPKIAPSHGKSMFKFLRTYHSFSYSSCIIYSPMYFDALKDCITEERIQQQLICYLMSTSLPVCNNEKHIGLHICIIFVILNLDRIDLCVTQKCLPQVYNHLRLSRLSSNHIYSDLGRRSEPSTSQFCSNGKIRRISQSYECGVERE